MKFKDQSGSSAVEFAIVLPMLLVLLFGIIEFSVALYDKAMITNASREGARFGIVYNCEVNGNVCDYIPPTIEGITAVVNAYLADSLITFGEPTAPVISTAPAVLSGLDRGDDLAVTVSYDYDFLVLPAFIDELAGDINAITVMRIE